MRATQGLELQLKASEATQGLELVKVVRFMCTERAHVTSKRLFVETRWRQAVNNKNERWSRMPRRGPEAAKHRPTAQQKRDRIVELEERAQLFGDSVKQSAQAQVLERKWVRFLLVHGEEYGFDARKGPTVELVKHFTTRTASAPGTWRARSGVKG